jgi:hypothetical protein
MVWIPKYRRKELYGNRRRIAVHTIKQWVNQGPLQGSQWVVNNLFTSVFVDLRGRGRLAFQALPEATIFLGFS